MQQIQFRTAVVVEGELYRDGDVEFAENVPGGTLESLLRLGQAVPFDADADADAEQPHDEQPSSDKPSKPKRNRK